jgi:hypothetical protein
MRQLSRLWAGVAMADSRFIMSHLGGLNAGLIDDIHGHAVSLERLLQQLGYSRQQGVYRHPERQATTTL